jgi:hypothetical protein
MKKYIITFQFIIVISIINAMGQSLNGIEDLLTKDSEWKIYLTEVYKTGPRNYYPEYEDFDKVVFTMNYKYKKETTSGLHREYMHAVVHFVHIDGDSTRLKIMGSQYEISSADREKDRYVYQNGKKLIVPVEWVENHFDPMVGKWYFIGYSDDTTCLPVKVLDYLNRHTAGSK